MAGTQPAAPFYTAAIKGKEKSSRYGKDFLNRTPMAKHINSRISKWYKIKNFNAKGTTERSDNLRMGEKIF